MKLSLNRGDSRVYRFEFRDESGTPLNLNNCIIRFIVKTNIRDNSATHLIDKNATITDATNGIAEVELLSTDTDIP